MTRPPTYQLHFHNEDFTYAFCIYNEAIYKVYRKAHGREVWSEIEETDAPFLFTARVQAHLAGHFTLELD